MLTVLRTHPEAVRCLLLNSPLPSAVNYEEGSLLNMNEALEQVFATYAQDSVAQPTRAQLRQQFRTYFTAITGKTFTLSYVEPGTRDSIRFKYTKTELLDAIVNRLTSQQVQTVPVVIQDIVQGHHRPYVREQVNQAFAGDQTLSLGMRYSVYCSKQLAYAHPALEAQQGQVLPWLAGYSFNNVTHAICRCWQVKPEPKTAKQPVYSAVPVLLTAGDLDPWCRPFYNQLLQRTLPNSQCLRFPHRGHAPGYSAAGVDYADLFSRIPGKSCRRCRKRSAWSRTGSTRKGA